MSRHTAKDLRRLRADAYESAREEVITFVPASARRVLDVGCATGALGEALKKRQQCEVVGVESDPVYATAASERLDRVVEVDVEELAARDHLEADIGRFDCLVAADVLEHLRDPWTALRSLSELLDPGCTAVVSLPNVRHWETFWFLGRWGIWPRREWGIHDRTHLRWFTLADTRELMVGAGLIPERIERRFRLRAWESPWDRRLARLDGLPGDWLFVMQYVIQARRLPAN